MNESQRKEQELFTILDNLEKSYNPQSPSYKFSYIFYNIVNQPFERPPNFPPQLWEQSLLPDRSLMPVILNKTQIDERRVVQNELVRKINESRTGIVRKIEALRVKREVLKGRLEAVIKRYRKVARQYMQGEPNDGVGGISTEVYSREPYLIRSSHKELVEFIYKMKVRLVELGRNVEEAVKVHERRHIREYQLDI
ncbi:hypothetical protein PAEPH01_0481 [Pancytospora epiphaga]|nr:hypothetical protein PAEPH01_0481 [Pancytospora epiphaga]